MHRLVGTLGSISYHILMQIAFQVSSEYRTALRLCVIASWKIVEIRCPAKKILLINKQGTNPLFHVGMSGMVQRQVYVCGLMPCYNSMYNNGFAPQRLLFECVHSESLW